MTGWTVLMIGHAGTALVGLPLGGYQLLRRTKGDRAHRVVGWVWVLGMLFVASSSFAIRDLRDGQLSLLHVLSTVTLVSLVIGIVGVRRGNIRRHRDSMRGSWIGLSGAFIAAVAIPSRHVPTFAVTDPLGAVLAVGVIAAATVGVILIAHGAQRLRDTATVSAAEHASGGASV